MPVSPKDDSFPGLYPKSLSTKCWSVDNKRVIINTTWRSNSTIISVDVETKQVTRLSTGLPAIHSLQVLDFDQDWICANLQSYTQASSLALAKLPPRGQESKISWTQVRENGDDEFSKLADTELLKFQPNAVSAAYPDLEFEAVFLHSKLSPAQTLIVFPHGGPHSAFTSEFSHHVAIFYSLGYSILLINYRGSTGFGQNSIDSLPGHIADFDVKDCQQAAEFVKNKYGFKNLVVQGGSHGGFLTLQLIGQYPDCYKAAAARNPVADLISMYHVTDIPDWAVCEALAINDYDPKFKIDEEAFRKMAERSPTKHIENVKTPTLFMVGKMDLRVPPWQSIEFYKALLNRNVPTKLLMYNEDNHPLDKPHTFADTIVHMILWFEKYLA